MRRHPWFKKLPTPQQMLESRMLKPFRHHLNHHSLWQFNRRSVAGGVAVGLFFGILIPFAQIFLSAIAAVMLRVNLPVAAFSTLVSNPLTFPALYYAAYKLGNFLTGSRPDKTPAAMEMDIQNTIEAQTDVGNWLDHLVNWVQSVVGLPFAIGLSTIAIVSGVGGYFLVNSLWRWHAARRWRARRLRRDRLPR